MKANKKNYLQFSKAIHPKYFCMLKLLLMTTIIANVMGLYDFKVDGLDGKPINFANFKGKKILIVNTASKCGYTPQYAELQAFHKKYKDKVVLIGFPANNFGGQEPGTNEEIQTFCKKNYGVSFLMAKKVSVKGEDIHPLFKYLTAEAKAMGIDSPIQWNFTKFLIDENGKLIKVFASGVKPLSEELTKFVN
jgi:glutathione peroxidase